MHDALWEADNMKRHPTNRLTLNNVDQDGKPVRMAGNVDDVIDTVAQAIRKAGRAQHVDQAEAVAQAVAARLCIELVDLYHLPPDARIVTV